MNEHNRPAIPEVTLVAVTSVAIGPTIEALEASMCQANFGRVLMLSDQPRPPKLNPSIEWRSIERLGSRVDYSRFMLQGLAEHVSTTHALCVQWDGFVLNGSSWRSSFLKYDYIGAVWPHFSDGHNVGNGGFSLRSRRLLDATRELPFDGSQLEDVLIGRQFRSALEERGIRFAPDSVARDFSYERTKSTGREFGFHGAFNLVRYLPASKATALFRSLEPAMLARSERAEILRWALARGRCTLAMAMLGRLL